MRRIRPVGRSELSREMGDFRIFEYWGLFSSAGACRGFGMLVYLNCESNRLSEHPID